MLIARAGIPFGIYLAFKWDLGLHGLWIGLTVSLVYSATFGTLISYRTDWDTERRRVSDRLEADNKRRSKRDPED
jgi:MATE family multidrug resistance protein